MLLVRASHSLPAAEALLREKSVDFTSFEIAKTAVQAVNLPESGHIIITSSAAVGAIPQMNKNCDYAVHCVHSVTAAAVEAAGHKVATVGRNNALALAEDIVRGLTPPELFHHLTTSTANTHWYSVLTGVGHAVQRHSAYSTEYVPELTKEAVAAIKRHEGVILCSQRGAEHLISLAKAATLEADLSACTAYCLSPAIADICAQAFKHTVTAEVPTLTSLLNSL